MVTGKSIRACLVAGLLSSISAKPIPSSELSILEASIEELQEALSSGQINAVQLLSKHLVRIAAYDRRGPQLNSIPAFNLHVFEDAQASDEYRANNGGGIRSAIEGIPFTVKDSYMLAGVPVAAGSPAFQNLVPHSDAYTVEMMKKGGAVGIGKTNMPPMANGGMQRGLYGRAESPYNASYLTAAMSSGSSNGAGTATGASFAVIGMGEETVSSGRSPASNNGLVAWTPSRGLLSIRGNWPLQPVADVVVPYTRTVKDMLALLDVLVVTDEDTTCDFWRGQPFVDLPRPEDVRPETFLSLANPDALKGKHIGVPRMFIGEDDPAAVPVYTSPEVRALWDEARATLESLGATVKEVDFPSVTNWDIPPLNNSVGTEWPMPSYWNGSSGPNYTDIVAYSWDDFLGMVNDTASITKLVEANADEIFPEIYGLLPDRGSNVFRNRTNSYRPYNWAAASRNGRDIYDFPTLGEHLQSLEDRRKRDLEDWMDELGLDVVAFPSAGDVGGAAVDTDPVEAEFAWRNGVVRSNGNAAIRQLGMPTMNVFMGAISGKGMPVDLTFAGKAYDDNALISYGFAFEQAHAKRFAPPRTPELKSDIIKRNANMTPTAGTKAPKLFAEGKKIDDGSSVIISGYVSHAENIEVEVYVDGVSAGVVGIVHGEFSIEVPTVAWNDSLFPEINVPRQPLAMVVVVASAPNGRSDGKLLFV